MTEKDLLEVLPPFIAQGSSAMVRAVGVVALPAGWLLFAVGAGNSVAAFGFMSAITRPPASDQRLLKPAAGFWRIRVPPPLVTGCMS
jgi:hypothetical protein